MVMVLEPTPPIFVIDREGGDVLAFDTVVAAAGFMEPPEVKEGAYLVYDAGAHEAVPWVRGWDVQLASWSHDPRPNELKALLADYLSTHGVGAEAEVGLGELVSRAAEVAHRLESDRARPRIFERWRNGRS